MTANRSSVSKARLFQFAAFLLSLAILWWLSGEVRAWMAFVFREPREDMGHGWIVPFFSLYLLFRQRKELLASAGRPSFWGFLLAIPGLLLFWIGSRGDQVRITQIAFFWLLWCTTYAFYGFAFAKVAAFPVIFLLFTVPLSFLDIFTVKLRLATAAIASALLNGIAIPVARSGTGLHCLAGQGFNLDIADPCSGMRSIFALTALTAAYAYLTQKTLLKKWILFFCSVPIAMLGNLARIVSIAVVAQFFGQEAATGFYHDYSGYVVFLIGLLAMMQAGAWLSKIKGKSSGPVKTAPAAPCPESVDRAMTFPSYVLVVLFPCVLFTTGRFIQTMPPPSEEPSSFLAEELPDLPGYRSTIPYYCQSENCGKIIECERGEPPPSKCPDCGSPMKPFSLGEATVLPPDTGFKKCNYYDALGDVFRVSVVVNGQSRQSIHRPEVCLPAQGFSMENGAIHSFPLDGGTSLHVHCVDLRRQDMSGGFRMGQGYFFVNARQHVASHWARMLISIRDRALYNRITRWAMVTVFCEESLTSTPERKRAVAKFFSLLYPAMYSEKRTSGEEAEP